MARDLVGCTLGHGRTAGVIVETEAYHESEPACHAYVGVTPRTRVLFGAPGHRLRVPLLRHPRARSTRSASREGVGAAVLIRALEPIAGLDAMRERRGAARGRAALLGPGQAHPGARDRARATTARDLVGGPVRIGPRPPGWEDVDVVAGTRIGITKAAELAWRFCAAGLAQRLAAVARRACAAPR